MSYTVVAIFSEMSEAEDAGERLAGSGFERENIDISRARGGETIEEGATREAEPEGGGAGSRIKRFFHSLFGKDEADRYSDVARQNDAVVTVIATSSDEAGLAARILDDAGAIDIGRGYEETYERVAGFETASTEAGARLDTEADAETRLEAEAEARLEAEAEAARLEAEAMPAANLGADQQARTETTAEVTETTAEMRETIPVFREEVEVGKRVVETGGARVRARIVERPIEETLRLREETVRVHRTPVDRPATPEELGRIQGAHIEVIEHAEVPVVAKKTRVVEEIELMKQAREHTEVVRETVRNTQVDVDEFEGKDASRRAAGTKESAEELEPAPARDTGADKKPER